MSSCKFCKEYQLYRDCEDIWDDEHYGKAKHDYTVALVVHSWYPSIGIKKNAGRTVHYRYNGFGFKLNFCPECGRNLSRKKIKEKDDG